MYRVSNFRLPVSGSDPIVNWAFINKKLGQNVLLLEFYCRDFKQFQKLYATNPAFFKSVRELIIKGIEF